MAANWFTGMALGGGPCPNRGGPGMPMITAKIMATCPCKVKIRFMRMAMTIATMALRTANIHMLQSPVAKLPLRTAQARRPGKPGIPMRREHRRTRISAMKAEVQSIQVEAYLFNQSGEYNETDINIACYYLGGIC